MSLFVPKFDESVIVRAAEAELVGRAPTTVRLLADSSRTGGALSTKSHAFAAVPGADADLLIVITPGVERFEYFRHLQRIALGEATVESLLEVQDLYDHFMKSEVWDGRHG